MSLPQLLMPRLLGQLHVLFSSLHCIPEGHLHPLFPGAAVPGAPVADLEMTQKSSVVPHWPQVLQQTFSRHGLSVAKSVPGGG